MLFAGSSAGAVAAESNVLCACSNLIDILLDGVSDTVKSRAGILAFLILSGSYATKSVGKLVMKLLTAAWGQSLTLNTC